MNEDKATRYHRLGRRAGILSTVWTGIILVALLLSGASAGADGRLTVPLLPAALFAERFFDTFRALLFGVMRFTYSPLSRWIQPRVYLNSGTIGHTPASQEKTRGSW